MVGGYLTVESLANQGTLARIVVARNGKGDVEAAEAL
jgi:hypothetical protein